MMIIANPSIDYLDECVGHAPDHVRPFLIAVRDSGVSWVVIPQGRQPFVLPKRHRPTIVVMGDDLFEALGPNAFNRGCMRRVLKQAVSAVIVSSGPDPRPYEWAASAAEAVGVDEINKTVFVAETRPEFEREWVEFVQEIRPGLNTLLCTVHPSERREQA